MEVLNNTFSDARLRVARVDRHGPAFVKSDVIKVIVTAIENDKYFFRRVKDMSKDVDDAASRISEMTANYSRALSDFFDLEAQLSGQTKKVSGSIKDAAEKIGQGIQRVEKAANFDRLEKYVSLLERAAAAMRDLSEIESSGKLDKIANALK
jgi:hypothetical protein